MVVEHLARIEGELARLPTERVALMAAACVERQWPLWELLTSSQGWRGEVGIVFKRNLEATWSWLAGTSSRPARDSIDYPALVEREAFDPSSSGELEKLMIAFASFCMGITGEGDEELVMAPQHAVYLAAELTQSDKRELVAQELNLQRKDLAFIAAASDLGLVVRALRTRGRRIDVLAE
jgi:hypothetical protein